VYAAFLVHDTETGIKRVWGGASVMETRRVVAVVLEQSNVVVRPTKEVGLRRIESGEAGHRNRADRSFIPALLDSVWELPFKTRKIYYRRT
jgi:hypothetical protein